MASLVAESRFKTIAVTKRVSIKAFVQEKKLIFKKGRGFYQLNKPELIQDYKEVIVRRHSDGKFVTGDQVREILGVSESSKKFKLDLSEVSDFDVFVQSTSVNRILLPGTEFLYEVEEEEAKVSLGKAFSTSYQYARPANAHPSIKCMGGAGQPVFMHNAFLGLKNGLRVVQTAI